MWGGGVKRRVGDNRRGLTVGVGGPALTKIKGEKREDGGCRWRADYESLRASFPSPLMYSHAKSVRLGLDFDRHKQTLGRILKFHSHAYV